MEVILLSSASAGAAADPVGEGVVDLANRAREAFANAVEKHGVERAEIASAVNDPRTASNPEALLVLQMKVAHHQLETTLATAFANHITKGVETLVKS